MSPTPPGVDELTKQIQRFLSAGGSIEQLSTAIANAVQTLPTTTETPAPRRPSRSRPTAPAREPTPAAPAKPARASKYTPNQDRFVKQWRQDLKAWKEEGLSARQAKARMREQIASGKTTRKGIRDSDFFKAWKKYEPKPKPRKEEPPIGGGAPPEPPGRAPPERPIGEVEADPPIGEEPPEEEKEQITNVVMYGMAINDSGEYAYVTEGNYYVHGDIDYPEIHAHLKANGMRMIKQGSQDRIFIGIQYMKLSEYGRRHPYHDLIERPDFLRRVTADLQDLQWYKRGDRVKARGNREIRRVRSPLRDEYEARIRGETYQSTLGDDEE